MAVFVYSRLSSVVLLLPLISGTLPESSAYRIRELERLRQSISLAIVDNLYSLDEPGSSAISSLLEKKAKKLTVSMAGLNAAMLTEIKLSMSQRLIDAHIRDTYQSLERVLMNEKSPEYIGQLYDRYFIVKDKIANSPVDDPVQLSSYLRLMVFMGEVIEYIARVHDKTRDLKLVNLEKGYRETTAVMLESKTTEGIHHVCATRMMDTVKNSIRKGVAMNFSLIKCLMESHSARPKVSGILDLLLEAKRVDGGTSYIEADTGRRWYNVSNVLPPGYTLEADLYGPFRARFSSSAVLKRIKEPISEGTQLIIQQSLKTFQECSKCSPGCVFDEHTRVFRPTKPGYFSLGTVSGCLEERCPVRRGISYVRGGLESAQDCAIRGGICTSQSQVLRDGQCTELEPGYVSHVGSDEVHECANKAVVSIWNKFFTKSSFKSGTCSIELQEPGIHMKLRQNAQSVLKDGRFTLEFEVTVISEDWGIRAVGSARVFGVKDKWKLQFAKSSTRGQGYLILSIGTGRLLSEEVKLIDLAGGKWKGQFLWTCFESYSYFINSSKQIILRAKHASFKWLNTENFMIGPETLENSWDYEISVNGLLDGPDLKGSMKTSHEQGSNLAKLAFSDLYEVSDGQLWAKKGSTRFLIHDPLPSVTVQVSQGGWPGLGTGPDDWPLYVVDRHSFFFGKQQVNITELASLLAGPVPRFPMDEDTIVSFSDNVHETSALLDASMSAHVEEVKQAVANFEEDPHDPVFEADLAVADDGDWTSYNSAEVPFYFRPLFLLVVFSSVLLIVVVSLCLCCCSVLRYCRCRGSKNLVPVDRIADADMHVLAVYARQAIQDLEFHMESLPMRIAIRNNSSPV